MKIGDKNLDSAADHVLIIAEMANAHEGSLQAAMRIVEAAADAEADGIKFQKFTAEKLLVPSHSLYQLYEKLMMRDEEWAELVKYAKVHGLIVFADVFDEESAMLMKRLNVDGFKIHSSDMNNIPLLKLVASFGKPTILASSGSTHIELANAINTFKQLGNEDIILMHGFQAFPTNLEDCELNRIRALQERYGFLVGCADHLNGGSKLALALPLVAIGAGARVVEKHITLDRALKGEDYESSLNPKEFYVMVKNIRKMEKALGAFEMHFSDAEKKYREDMKKKLVAKIDIAQGTIISEDILTYKRVEGSQHSAKAADIIGKSAKALIQKDELITFFKLSMKVAILIAVKMGSTRLPGKALMEIEEQSILAHLIDRLRLAKTPQSIMVCTTTRPDDEVIVEIARQKGVKWFRGNEDDVMDRFIQAAEIEGAEVIVRVTGDDILRDPYYLDRVVEYHLQQNADYTKVAGLPYGTDSEAISLSALKKAHTLAEDPRYSEYMTWYMDNPEVFNVAELVAEPKFRRPDYRLGLDYPEDLKLMKEIFNRLYKKDKPPFSLEEVINLLDNHPELPEINAHVKPKDVKDKVNTRLRLPEIHQG